MVFDITNLAADKKEKIIDGTKKYIQIFDLYNSLSLLNDLNNTQCVTFQKTFNSFYKLIRHNATWYNSFYDTFDKVRAMKNIDFCDVYKILSKQTGRDEKSFSSKMYHTINNNSPIIDQNVLKGLKIKGRSKKGNGIAIYKELWNEYYKNNGLIDCAKRDNLSDQFDSLCRRGGIKVSDLSKISLVKKIDFYLWANFSDKKGKNND